ncbi:MAG TPA: phosphodiester glycosidase family protein [Gemmatimonadaceae bacterium]|nr:phosphodiester glycosidase family protein [Gemmatimonadaceae bacterium]
MIFVRAALIAVALVLQGVPGGAQQAPLAVSGSDGWRGLWRPDLDPPARWHAGDSALLRAMRWRRARGGMMWAELPLRGDGEAWRTRAIVVRIDPRQVRFRLDTAFSIRRDAHGAPMRLARWRVQTAAAEALLAVNAGQFSATLLGTLPWGWVVINGREWLPPGVGPLSTAVVFDSTGSVRLMPVSALAAPHRGRGVQSAFQSFPTLLEGDGEVPTMLRVGSAGSTGIDRTHRDARLAIGVRRDGSVLLVLTRFDVFGRVMGAAPFGLTTPEMSALMGALGCARAVMLDGGISAQLQLRDGAGVLQRWEGWRRVPLGLVVMPR